MTIARHWRFGAEDHAEDKTVNSEYRGRVDEGPEPTQNALLVARLELSLSEVVDEAAIGPQLRGRTHCGSRSPGLLRGQNGAPFGANRTMIVAAGPRHLEELGTLA